MQFPFFLCYCFPFVENTPLKKTLPKYEVAADNYLPLLKFFSNVNRYKKTKRFLHISFNTLYLFLAASLKLGSALEKIF